jgi:regulator of nonsense transcripts 3
MAPSKPKFTIAKPNGGVIPITAQNAPAQANGAPETAKTPAARLKVVVRRLPPGLTQGEFEAAVGEEWLVGGGNIDWMQYKPGKISQEYASERFED